jgi:hypothetical protein
MSSFTMHLVPVVPARAVLLLSAALLAVLAHGSLTLLRRQVHPRRVAILASLRVIIVALFALALLQPVLSYTHTVERRPEMLVLLDTSESMTQPGGIEGATRLEEVVRALDEGGLAAELGRRFELRWFAFDRGAAPLEGAGWKTLSATGPGTHYADSLTQACSYPRASGDSLAAALPERVLLVSDGQDRGSPDVVETARRLGVAIDVLATGSPKSDQEPARITVADVQGARRVLLGSETHFLVTLRNEPTAADRKVTVHLSEEGKDLEPG